MFKVRTLIKFLVIFLLTVFILSFNCLHYWVFSVFNVLGQDPLVGNQYNYAEVLQKAVYFYDVQRSGKLPTNNRVEWRGDSALTDGADNGIDLTGGWYDAGDHLKFGFPMAASTTLLAWGVIEYEDAYKQSGQYNAMLDNLRWVNDYLIKAHPQPTVLWGQVGKGSLDHGWWGAAEVMQMERPSYKIDATCSGSDLAGETAAAMAASALVFQEIDADYSQTLLKHAQELYDFAEDYPGNYSDCIPEAADYYKSSGYTDELVWGAAWLYRATQAPEYLEKAETYYEQLRDQPNATLAYNWTHTWDDKSYGSYVLLAELTGKNKYREDAERWLDYWCDRCQWKHIYYTPGGLAWLSEWGSLRYAAKTAFLAFIYGDSVDSAWRRRKYHAFAERQINYILGSNPDQRSYVVGFGNNAPRQPHHRTAHGSWANSKEIPEETRHILYGALVGGPDQQDIFIDERANFQMTEVATDYNAGFTGAVAKLFQKYGGKPLANFPEPERRDDEFFVEAQVNQPSDNLMEVNSTVYNQSAWPARIIRNLSFRYFIDISEIIEAGGTPTDITVSASPESGITVSGLTSWQPSSTIYYIQVDVDGTQLSPGGEASYKKDVQFQVSTPIGIWIMNNDWSYQEMLQQTAKVKRTYIPIYNSEQLFFGVEPSKEG